MNVAAELNKKMDGLRRRAIIEFVREHADMSLAELEAVSKSMDKATRELVRDVLQKTPLRQLASPPNVAINADMDREPRNKNGTPAKPRTTAARTPPKKRSQPNNDAIDRSVLFAVKEAGPISKGEIIEETGASPDQVRRSLDRLNAAKAIKLKGAGKASRWVLA